MRKFGKFIFGTLALASIGAGAYYVYKNFIKKDSSDDFDDFEDDFEELDSEETPEKESREYVPINIAPEENSVEASEELTPLQDEEAEDEQ